jgi:hypothetical protein
VAAYGKTARVEGANIARMDRGSRKTARELFELSRALLAGCATSTTEN